jgi:hypothetical protein
MAMNTDTFETFETLFPNEFEHARSDASVLFLGIVCFITDDPNVECVIQRSSYDHTDANFSPEQGFYGRSLRNKHGEEVWLRVRSFNEQVPLPNRAFEALIPGEIREIVAVVGSLQTGIVTTIRAFLVVKE